MGLKLSRSGVWCLTQALWLCLGACEPGQVEGAKAPRNAVTEPTAPAPGEGGAQGTLPSGEPPTSSSQEAGTGPSSGDAAVMGAPEAGPLDEAVTVPGGTVKAGFMQLDIGAHIDDGVDPEDMLTPGSVQYEAGSWTLTGSGEGFIHGWDQGNLVVTEAAGDLTITVRVVKLEMVEPGESLDGAAQALINVRSSLDPDENLSVIAAITPDKLHFMARQQDPAESYKWWYRPAFPSQWPPARPAPRWLRLTRRGDVFSAYLSEDGQTFQSLADLEAGKGQPLEVKGMPERTFVGIGCSARNDRNYVPNDAGGRKDPSAKHLLRSARCMFTDLTITQP